MGDRIRRRWVNAVKVGLVMAGTAALGTTGAGCKPIVRRAIIQLKEARARSERTPRPPPGEPATLEEASEFAAAINAAVSAHQSIRGLLDGDVFVDRSLGDLDLPLKMTRPVAQELSQQIDQSLEELLKGGGSYRCLANRVVEGERRVKFRLLQAGGGFNYHDYVVVKREGKVRAVDVHLLLLAEPMSRSVRRAVLPLAVDANQGVLARLNPAENSYCKHLDTIRKMIKGRDPREVLAAYRQLPDDLKDDKNLLMMRLQAASTAVEGDEPFLAAMNDYQRVFPDDPSAQIVSIDYSFLKKRYAEALDAIRSLEQSVGPDPHLAVLRATAFMDLGQPDRARAEVEHALLEEPDLAEALGLGILLDLHFGDDGAALAKVDEGRRRKVDLSSVEKNPAFAALVLRRAPSGQPAEAPPSAFGATLSSSRGAREE